ncbi:MAG: transketolase, partial [Bradyrhizobium sp.]
FTIEEHTLIGGLGSAVVDLLIEQGPVRQIIKKLGLTDSFVKNYGLQDDLLEINGLMPPQIAATVEKTLAAARQPFPSRR